MPLTFDIRIFGANPFARTIERTGKYASDLRPVWHLIEENILDINSQQMITEGRRGLAGAWTPMADSTRAYKASHGFLMPLLQRSGDLYDAVAAFSSPNRNVYKGAQSLGFIVTGEPGRIGAIHQKGAPSVGLPQRKVIDWTEADKVQFIKDIQRYVLTGKVDFLR